MEQHQRQLRFMSFFLISYIPLILIPMIMGVVLYFRTADLIKEEVIIRNATVLEQSRKSVENIYITLDDISTHIASSSYIMTLLNLNNKDQVNEKLYTVRQAQAELARYLMTNMAIEDVFVWFPNIDLMISLETSYLNAHIFYDSFFKFDGQTFDDWNRNVMQSRSNGALYPAVRLTSENMGKGIIPYVQSLPYNNPGENRGAVIITFSEQEIHHQLQGCIEDSEGWVFILSEKGEVITRIGNKGETDIPERFSQLTGYNDLKFGTRESVAIYDTSLKTGWQFLSIIPKKIIFNRLYLLRGIMLVSLFFTLLLTVSFAIMMAMKRSRPFSRLVQAAHIDTTNLGYVKLLENIENTILDLDQSNQRLNEDFNRYLPGITASLINRLLEGQITDMEELKGSAEQLGLNLNGKSFSVLIIKLAKEAADTTKGTLARLNINKLILRRRLLEETRERLILHDSDTASLTLLICDDSEDHDFIRAKWETLFTSLFESIPDKMDFVCTGGHFYSSPLDLHMANYEAKNLMELQVFTNEAIHWFNGNPKIDYYYPLSEEQRIISIVKSGDFQKLDHILETIIKKNLSDSENRRSLSILLFREMHATLVKCVRETGYDDHTGIEEMVRPIATVRTYGEADRFIGELKESYRQLCNHMNNKKKSHNSKLCSRIINYLDENYTEGTLSLRTVSEHFRMSDVYFSQFFKEQTGVNFFSYIETKRLNQARILLTSGSNVDEAARKTGYNSSATFRRAYKRHFSITPSKEKGNS